MSFAALRRIVGSCAVLALVAGCGGGGVQTGLRVEIEATPESGAFPLTVSLKANVNGQPAPDDATYEWDLGDGETSTEPNPVHVFTDIGTYEVSLRLKSKGKKGAASHTIEVLEVGAGTDIAVESVEATPASVNPGSQFTVKITLRNRGTLGVDSAFFNRVYLSTVESGFDPATAGAPNGVVNMTGIGGAETVDKSTTVSLPTSFAEDEYWIWIHADAGDSIDETDEANNVFRSTSKVTVTSTTLPIDIAVTEPVLSATTFTPGSPVTVDTTLSNPGTADAGQFTLKVFLSPDPTVDGNDVLVHTATIAGLVAGANEPQSLAVDVPADVINRPWYLGVIADVEGVVPELGDDSNNFATYGAGTVLTAGGSGCTEDANEPNDTEAEATVLPMGTTAALQLCGDTTDWFQVELGAGDRLQSQIDFQNVNGNLDLAVFRMGTPSPLATSNTSANTESVNSGIALTEGTYLVRVTLAGSAGGNTYDLTAALEDNGGPGVDLMPTQIAFGSGSGPYAPGMAHSAGVTVYNFGMTASTSFDVALHLSTDETLDGSDVLLGTVNVPMLAAGGSNADSRSVTIPGGTAPGYYYLIATADSGAVIAEDVEGNNALTKLIGVGTGCLDDPYESNDTYGTATPMDNGTYTMLQICTAGSSSGDIYAITTGAGGTVEVSIQIADAADDFDMTLTDANGNEPPECDDAGAKCSSLSVSSMESVRVTSTSGGTYYVKVYGYGGSVGAYTMTVSGSTGSMPDLSPNSVTASPAAVMAGDDVQVDGRIKNNSTMATGAFDWSVRLSTDATIDGGDTTLATVSEAALAAGENRLVSKKVTLPDTLPGGNYWLGIVADPAGMVEEGSEANNVGVIASPVAVTALCADDGYEENDTLGSAAPIAIGGTIPALAVCSNDLDFFAVTPAANGTLSVHLDFSHAMGDVDLHLYQGNSIVASSISVTDDEDLSYAVTGGTTYKIRVRGFNGAANDYTLSTTLAP